MLTGALGDLGDLSVRDRGLEEQMGGGYSLLNLLPDMDFSGFGPSAFSVCFSPLH